MNSIFISLLFTSILHLICPNSDGKTGAETAISDLKWVTHKTKFPIVFQKTHNENPDANFDWYKFDEESYVTEMASYKPNYFVSKQSSRSELAIFEYNSQTHEQLTSYQPVQTTENDQSTDQHEVSELHTLAYLKSHRIRIDRDQLNSIANVSCIADFLVDRNSLSLNKNLIAQMKHLAFFKINLNEPNKADYNEFTQRIARKNFFQINDQKINRHNYGQFDQRQMRFKRFNQEKVILNVRLSFGPIMMVQPFDERLISCSLNLVNAGTVDIEYHNKIFKFLTRYDMGLDKNVEDSLEMPAMTFGNPLETSTAATATTTAGITTTTTTSTSTTTPTITKDTIINSVQGVEEISNDELDKIFLKEEARETFIEKISEEEKEFVNGLEVNKQLVQPETEEEQGPVKDSIDRRFFNLDDKLFDDKSSMLFMLDKPSEINKIVNSAKRHQFDFTIVIMLVFLNACLRQFF